MALQDYEVTKVSEYFPNPDTACWLITMRKPDGTLHQYIFPKETLAWRAAEYDIDPANTELLLDIVLHEPFAPHPCDPLTAANDPVAKAGIRSPATESRGTTRAGDLVPTTLYTARTAAEARDAHLMRIQYTKANIVRVTLSFGIRNADPLDKIRQTPIDSGAVARLRTRVDETRRRLQGERIPRSPALAAPPYDPAADRRTADLTKEANRA